MSPFACSTASERDLADLALLVTRSFEGYFVPIFIDEAHLLSMVRMDSVDLSLSRIAIAEGEPAGIALMARRGWTSRVAAMGVVSGWRGKGVGRFLMNELQREAHARADRKVVLEVIEQNDPAVRLYESAGFRKVRRLVSLSRAASSGSDQREPEEIDIRELARLIGVFGLPDLPWQLSAETIAHYGPPFRAYHLDGASALISDPEAEDVRFYSLLVEPSQLGQDRATQLVQAILARHPRRTWRVPAIFPEELAGPFLAAGFHRDTLSQWQMEWAN